MLDKILIYGSYGYTGDLITELAVKEGAKPTLAGRSPDKLEAHAAAHGLPRKAFALDDAAKVAKAISGFKIVLHCAGPFSRTARPMAEACMKAGAHYLDITGEIEVFETMAALDAKAKQAGVMLMPGTGFDVVPSDCLAAHMKRRMPDAIQLTLAFQAIGRPSRGTATTMMENIHKGGAIRRDGKITPVPSAWKTMTIDFGSGPVNVMTIPWGDVSTAYHSTGIPNIQVYMAAPAQLRSMAKMSRYFGWLMGSGPVQSLLRRQVQAGPAGPSDEERAKGKSHLWAEVKNRAGKPIHTRMTTPEGYTLTAMTAWDIAKQCAGGAAKPGFQTPSRVFGPDFILKFPGVTRDDLEQP
jgi:short subunit dehydrogenase-like uncharacterized protein